jgi:hypothetical protein
MERGTDEKSMTFTNGQVWAPHNCSRAPRRIQNIFTDVTGALTVRWAFPGFPNSGESVSFRSFVQWAKRTNATLSLWPYDG